MRRGDNLINHENFQMRYQLGNYNQKPLIMLLKPIFLIELYYFI
jgi:hypothetical protein